MLEKDITDRISDLLNIVEKISTVAPQYMNISGEAMSELREIDAGIRDRKAKESPPPQDATAGQPSTEPPVPSQPVGARAIPASSFEAFNTDPGLLGRRLPSGSDLPPEGEPDTDQGDLNV